MMKNIIFFIACCNLFNMTILAQNSNSSTLAQLQGKEWIMWFPSKESFTMKATFTSDNIWHVFFLHKGEELDMEQTYCISNSSSLENIELVKRERLETGKYLISENKTETVAYEIVKLTSDSLILKRLDSFSILTFQSSSKK